MNIENLAYSLRGGFPCVGTGNLQPNTKEKPMFRLGELVEFRFYGDGLSIRIVHGIFKLCRQ
ncbi:DUF1392 family protein [Nostoc sp.]